MTVCQIPFCFFPLRFECISIVDGELTSEPSSLAVKKFWGISSQCLIFYKIGRDNAQAQEGLPFE